METCHSKNSESFLTDYETNRDLIEPLENLNRDLKIELAKYKRAYEAAVQLHRSLNSALVVRSILDVVSSLFFIGSAAVIRLGPDKRFRVLGCHNTPREAIEELLGHIDAMIDEIRVSRRPVIVADSLKDKNLKLISADFPSIGLIPMILGHEAYGAILINNWQEGSFSGALLDVLNLVASSAAVALQNAENFEVARRCMFMDSEIGVYNRKYFQDYLKHFLDQQKACPMPASILLIGLKNHRELEDRWGRQFPITAMKRTANHLSQNLTRPHILFRYNTSTLCLIFPGSGEKDLTSITYEVERISSGAFQTLGRQLEKEPNFAVTVSGLFVPSSLNSVKEVIQLIDHSLNSNGNQRTISIEDKIREDRARPVTSMINFLSFRKGEEIWKMANDKLASVRNPSSNN